MRIINKKYYLASIFIILFTIIFWGGCNKSNKTKTISSYRVVDSFKIDFKKATTIYAPEKIQNFFVCINMVNRTDLILFDDNGNILSTYDKKGKGPQEILRAQSLAVFNTKLYVIDSDNNKLLTFKLSDKELKYIDEFKLKTRPMDIAIINPNRILITSGGTKSLFIYNKNGKLLKDFSINNKQNINTLKDFLSTLYAPDKFAESNKIVLSNAVSGQMIFCDFDEKTANILFKKKIKPALKVKNNTNISTNKKGETSVDLNTIVSHGCSLNKFYILFDYSQNNEFEVYNTRGEFLGLSKIIGINKKINNCIFSANANILYFMKKGIDNMIFSAAKE